MKQVIVRVQKETKSGYKTIARFDYTSSVSYDYYVFNDVKDYFKEGITIYVKVGNQFFYDISYDNVITTMEEYPDEYETVEDKLNAELHYSDLMYYVKDYLGRW